MVGRCTEIYYNGKWIREVVIKKGDLIGFLRELYKTLKGWVLLEGG